MSVVNIRFQLTKEQYETLEERCKEFNIGVLEFLQKLIPSCGVQIIYNQFPQTVSTTATLNATSYPYLIGGDAWPDSQ